MDTTCRNLLGNKFFRLIDLIHRENGLPYDEITDFFYESVLYKDIENEATGLQHAGIVELYYEFMDEYSSSASRNGGAIHADECL